jgi:hypothetical protein
MKKILTAVILVCAWSGMAFAKESQLEKANNVLNEIGLNRYAVAEADISIKTRRSASTSPSHMSLLT